MPARLSPDETVALLEATLESTRDGILVVGLDRRIILYNSRFADMFALPLAVGGAIDTDAITSSVIAELEEPDEFILRSAGVWSNPEVESVALIRLRDGRVFERFVAPHRLGTMIGGVVASYRDVTESLRMQEALVESQALLERAQEVAQIGSWVAELDESDRLTWSRETFRIFGLARGDFPGTSAAFFSYVHPDDRAAVQAASEAAVARGVPYDIEHRIVRGDGSIRFVHEVADLVRDASGRAIRMIGTVQDVTERRHLEEQLRHAQKMEAIGRLAGGIAHDLNNGLTAIAGYTELALDELPPDHPAWKDIAEIRRAAERAGSVTRQLLAFSRKELLEPRVFDLNDTIASLGRMLSRLLGEDITLETHELPSLPPILGDPGQVEQAILNLAVNARDAMPSGGRLTLSTSIEIVDEAFARSHLPIPAGRYVVLSVADTGHGMSPDVRLRVFEPFFTTKEIGKGTGLGLSMVFGTVKQSGGFIFVESEPGRGTTFRLYFPPAPRQAPVEVGASAAPVTTRPTETVLVVEDEAGVRALVSMTLEKAGYTVLTAESGPAALVITSSYEERIDLLLTDAIMPGMSGIELANLLVPRRPDMLVLIMSGYTEEALNVKGVQQPVTLIQKPFTPPELRARIREVLNRHA